jgi:hypothetical protein
MLEEHAGDANVKARLEQLARSSRAVIGGAATAAPC